MYLKGTFFFGGGGGREGEVGVGGRIWELRRRDSLGGYAPLEIL